jgi:RNA polymerase sigma-70 factor, ECF subfamily
MTAGDFSYPLVRARWRLPDREDRLEELWREHAGPLFGFLAYRTGDHELAQDLLADAFERAIRARRRFDPRRGTAKAWLYTIALNVARDHDRRQAAERRALGTRVASDEGTGDDGAAVALHTVELRIELASALNHLDPREREAVALRYGADLSMPELARVTGEPLTTVEARVYRALRKLRARLTIEAAETGATAEPQLGSSRRAAGA